MSKILCDTGAMSVDGNRERAIIRETAKSYIVEHYTMYAGEPQYRMMYHKNEVPAYLDSAVDYWLGCLSIYKPYRVIDLTV